MTKLQEKYLLTSENVDKASATFFSVCQELRMDRKESIKQRLAFEEALLMWASSFGPEQEFELIVYKRLFTPYIAIRVIGRESINPFTAIEGDDFSRSIINALSNEPEYFYSKGINTAVFKLVRPEMSPMIQIGFIILASVSIGILGQLLLPENVIASLLTYFVDPLYSTFLGLLSCIAGPLIFLSVAWGIYGVGDVATFNKLGKSLMGYYVVCVAITACLSVLCFPILGLHLTNTNTDYSQLFSLLQLFLDMFPKNIVEPFATGNTIQIIVLAIVMGIALLFLGKRSSAIATAIDQLNSIINFTLSIIGKLVPVFISLILIEIVWSGKLIVVADTWRLAIVDLAGFFICCLVLTLTTAVTLRISPGLVAKKSMPSALVAFSTSSSAASFEELVITANKRFGVGEALTKFGVPLGIVTSKMVLPIEYALAALYVASISEIKVSIGWLLTVAFVSAVTSVATPPIPGGSSIAFTMLFTQLGLSMENMGVILALDLVIDFFITGSNVYCIPLELACVANKFGLIDREVLTKDI
ncbi:MAG: cation:dicarboxylase symporter family transporter [Bacillota bacterium]|nr:cation:dicarboxylase symporter family transporter [Bacillota bacterium]